MDPNYQPPLTNLSSLGPAIEKLYTTLRGASPGAAASAARQFINQQVGGPGTPGLYYPRWEDVFTRNGTVMPALPSGAMVRPDAQLREPLARLAERLVALVKDPRQGRLNAAVKACEEFLEALGVDPVPSNGPEGGRWVRWMGKRCPIPKGIVYRMVDYFWNRDSATYDELEGPVFENPVAPQTIRSWVNKVNTSLMPIGVPWRLSADSNTRHVTKQPRP
jgi:hypothetical protein